MIDLRKEEIKGLKDHQGGIFCYVSKNQIAKKYLDYLQGVAYRGINDNNQVSCSEQDIAITNVLIEGLSDNGLTGLWNTLHGFKHELIFEIGNCFRDEDCLARIISKNDVEGTFQIIVYYNKISSLTNKTKTMTAQELIKEFPQRIEEKEFYAKLEEWEGNDQGKIEQNSRVDF